MVLHVNITFAVVFFFAQTACAVYANLQGADALHMQTLQRRKDISKVGFTKSTTKTEN